MKLYVKILIALSIVIAGLAVVLFLKDRRGEKYEELCRMVQVGESMEDVIAKMGQPKSVTDYYNKKLGKHLEVYSYPIPLLASSNIDVYFDKELTIAMYPVCNEPTM